LIGRTDYGAAGGSGISPGKMVAGLQNDPELLLLHRHITMTLGCGPFVQAI
jgi:hypothetical protein